MDWLIALYTAQPFWLWLAIGVALLGIEAMFSTEWLLWPAAAAGITAVAAAVFPLGFAIELGLFGLLTVVLTLVSRRLVKRVNPDHAPDINDPRLRLIGKTARVVGPFIEGHGRVYISGAEWPADIVGGAPNLGDTVIVESAIDGRLVVRVV